jgi:DNA-binding GntR family transcriptional regulator
MSLLQEIAAVPDLTEQVYTRLLSAICAGELAPGARLTQEELAASLSVSRQPVLQALRMLKQDGVAIDAGRRGLIVAPIDARFIEQLYEVRGVLEGLAARLAALAGAKIDPDLVERGRAALARGHFPTLIDADMAFHNAIYTASGNPLIAETAGRHWHHIRRAMGGVLRTQGARDWVWEEHQAIIDAINAGDAPAAEQRARAHCAAGGRVLATALTGATRATP